MTECPLVQARRPFSSTIACISPRSTLLLRSFRAANRHSQIALLTMFASLFCSCLLSRQMTECPLVQARRPFGRLTGTYTAKDSLSERQGAAVLLISETPERRTARLTPSSQPGGLPHGYIYSPLPLGRHYINTSNIGIPYVIFVGSNCAATHAPEVSLYLHYSKGSYLSQEPLSGDNIINCRITIHVLHHN